MKAVLISTRPKWCEKIFHKIGENADGTPIYKKRVEVRKTRPKCETPFKVLIYCTKEKTIGDFILCKSNENAKLWGYNTAKGINKGFAEKEDVNLKGKVMGEFVCDKMYFRNCDIHDFDTITLEELSVLSCVSEDDLLKYADRGNLYGWHISNLVIYDKPKALSEFETECKGGCDFPYVYEPPCENCGKNRLTRPPQSWCYVQEVHNG